MRAAPTELTLIPPTSGALGEPIALSEDARGFARASLSESTRRNYAAQWRLWSAYTERDGLSAMPADPVAVANWVSHRVLHGTPHAARAKGGRTGQTLGTARAAIAAITTMHRLAGHEFDSGHKAIKAVLAGIRRERPEAQRQVKAMPGALVSAILAGMGDSVIELRDAALLAVGYAFARRRSELVGLDWHAHGVGDGWLGIDDTHITLTLLAHKTQGAEPLVVVVPRATNPALTRALERWTASACIEPGRPLFQGVSKSGRLCGGRLHGQSVAGIIKRRVQRHLVAQGTPRQRAEELAAAYSGHSLRSGFCTTAAEAGADPLAIATVSGHRGLAMVQRYTAQADKQRRSPHNLAGVGLGQRG